ncbi:XRE family transcriptional regulator [Asticcacaulis sp.]|uniref:helix-turn-helix transcriptional regulator n=1 Tax=Asticcacaulis sp. TaxID=1872648 RepID=UPI0031D728D7
MSTAARVRIEPRGLSKHDAAAYIGISATKFDQLIADGRMPAPKRIDGRVLWDRFDLDAAWDALPTERAANPLDNFLR